MQYTVYVYKYYIVLIYRIDEYEKDLQIANEKNSKLQSELIECNNELSYVQAEKKEIQSQMGVINQVIN